MGRRPRRGGLAVTDELSELRAEVERLKRELAEARMTIRDLVTGGYEYEPPARRPWWKRLLGR